MTKTRFSIATALALTAALLAACGPRDAPPADKTAAPASAPPADPKDTAKPDDHKMPHAEGGLPGY